MEADCFSMRVAVEQRVAEIQVLQFALKDPQKQFHGFERAGALPTSTNMILNMFLENIFVAPSLCCILSFSDRQSVPDTKTVILPSAVAHGAQ
jgi:hypothetical protein